jgi:hypothetical protein
MNKYPVGTIVCGVDETFSRSQYEVLADNGFMLLLLFRELSGIEDRSKTNLCIRPRDLFKIKENPSVKKSLDIELSLPFNWYVNFNQIKIIHKGKTGSVNGISFN